MTALKTQAPVPAARIGGGPTRSVAAASWTALGALLLRDLVVLRKHIWEFALRTIIQPFLLCFVFLYVFPKIGQGIGGRARQRSPVGLRHHLGAGRGRDFHHVPGRAVHRAGHGPGVRLHPGDRGPGAGALPDLAGGDGEGALRRGPGRAFRGHRAADRLGGARARGAGPHHTALVDHRDVGAAGVHRDGRARPGPRDQLRAAEHRPDVRLHHLADHVPGLHLLCVDQARAGHRGRLALAADGGTDQPAGLRERGDARRLHQRCRTCTFTSSTRWWPGSPRYSWPSACATSAAGCSPSRFSGGQASAGAVLVRRLPRCFPERLPARGSCWPGPRPCRARWPW